MLRDFEIGNVLCIRPQSSMDTGTGFIVYRSGQAFLITALHVVRNESGQIDPPLFYKADQWIQLETSDAIASDEIDDIAVFPVDGPGNIERVHSIDLNCPTIHLGHPALIAGFPFGWTRNSEKINSNFPMPIVKGVLLSGVFRGGIAHDTKDRPSTAIILDRGIPQGFSGAPVFLRDAFGGIIGGPKSKVSYVAGVVIQQVNDEGHIDLQCGLGLATHAGVPLKLIKQYLNEEQVPDVRRWEMQG